MITPRRRKRDSFLPWVQLAVDSLTIFSLLHAAFWFRFESGFFPNELGTPDEPIYVRSYVFVALVVVWFLRSSGLYRPARSFTFLAEIGRVFKAVVMGTLVLTAMTFFFRGFSFSRTYLLLAGLLLAAGISLARVALGFAVMWVDERRGSPRNVVIVGDNPNARKLIHFYSRNRRFGTRVIGILDDALPKGSAVESVEVWGRVDELGAILKTKREVHEVVLADPGLPQARMLKMISDCEKLMVGFRWIADIFGLIASKMSVSYLAGVPLLSFVDSPLGDWENRVLKRTMDIFCSAAALVFLSPAFLAIAIAIRADSRGPVFFRQQRIGQDGRRFVLFKFRTMGAGAEEKTGPVWASENDPRRTRVGTFLRKTNLDELPQLWNVLKGEMSLVGPRPERPFFVSQFMEDIPRYMARHTIRSGMTGWAQVNGLRGNTSIEERTKYDLFYIENWSPFFDAKILFMTVFRLFSSPNAY